MTAEITGCDQRPAQTPVRDQGDRPTCVAFAVTAAHEWMAGSGEDLSPEHAHWAAKARDGHAGEATTAQAALTGIAEERHAVELAWPYGQPAWPAPPPPEASLPSNLRTPGTWRRLGTPTIGELSDLVAQGVAVILTVRFVPAAWSSVSDSSPVVDAPAGVAVVGSHAILVVGARAANGQGNDAILIKNSWGAEWGDAGYAFLSDRYLDAYGVVAHALEAS